MIKHTPGPWHVASSGVSIDAGPIRIRQENGASAEIRKANARLIAAAPELLRDLIEATAWLAGIGNWDEARDRDLRRFADTVRRAQGAAQED